MQIKLAVLAPVLAAFICTPSPADELRVGFSSQCPISAESARESALAGIGVALLADFGGRLVGGLIDQIGSALADDKQVAFRATGRMAGFFNKTAGETAEVRLNKPEGCLIVALGEFGGTGSAAAVLPKAAPPPSSEDIKRVTDTFGPISQPLKFYMEGVFDISRDRTAFAFVPMYVYYPAFLYPGHLFSSSKRDFLVRVEWSQPGEAAFGTSQLQWNAIAQADDRVVIASRDELKGMQTEWMKAPSVSAPAAAGPFAPVNVKVLVTETAKPHTLAKYFGEALRGQKEQITTATRDAITQSVSTEARLQAKLKLNEAAQSANSAYGIAYDDAQKAFDAFNEAKDASRQEKLNAARLAYQKVPPLEQLARRAFENAGLSFEPRPALKPLP